MTVQARESGRMLEHESAKLVIIVDQLEELFANDRLPPANGRSSSSCWPAWCAQDVVWVLATMRKDFWHRADKTPELARLSEGNGRLELLPPGPAHLSQMIRRPAEAAGVSFEVHGTTNVPLNDVIAEEVAREPGTLPLLSYLLDQLYRSDVAEASGHMLTYATYESLGRLEGAIATKAEAVLERCAPEDPPGTRFGAVLARVDGYRRGRRRACGGASSAAVDVPQGTPHRRLMEAFLDPMPVCW